MLNFEWDIEVAIVQKNIECTGSAVLIALQPGQLSAVGANPHNGGNDGYNCCQYCQVGIGADYCRDRVCGLGLDNLRGGN